MSYAVIFALLSLLFAGFVDVVFKSYARENSSRGMLICGIGIVWLVLQLVYLSLGNKPLSVAPVDIGYGLAAGIMVTLSNILLIECLAHLQISLGSTIYRLNTIAVVILSVVFLGESFVMLKILGVGCGVVGVYVLYRSDRLRNAGATDLASTFFWVAILASFLRGTYGVTTKAGLVAGANPDTLIVLSALCWIAGGLAYAGLREKRIKVTRRKVVYSLYCGVLVVLVVNFLIHAIELGEASTVVPIANLSFVAALLISVAMKWERLTSEKTVAIGLAAASIFLLARIA